MVARALHDEVCAGLARAADLGPDACEAGTPSLLSVVQAQWSKHVESCTAASARPGR